MIYNLLSFLLLSFFASSPKVASPKTHTLAAVHSPCTLAETLYRELKADHLELPSLECFSNAVEGFYNLKAQGHFAKDILTIADFSKSSNTKRLWVIDMNTKTILFNTLVAHGRKTGDEFAQHFSNGNQSYMSSLGFYETGGIYNGKHGLSLKLNGLEKGVNDNALGRAVVMHGADYVSENFIKQNHRLGRSLGCPAIPQDMVKPIISAINGNSCLYIYHPCHCKKKEATVS